MVDFQLMFTKYCLNLVCSITDCGSEVIGFHEFFSIEKIHDRAIRAFLGLGKSTPIPGMRTQTKVMSMFHRLVCMSPNSLTKKIFLWDFNLSETARFSTWSNEAKQIFVQE